MTLSRMLSFTVLSGTCAGLAAAPATAQNLLDLVGTAGDRLGIAVHAAGDFDHDGFPDVLVAADQSSKNESLGNYVAGAVAILSGRNGGLLFLVTGDDYTAQTGNPLTDFNGSAPFAPNAAMVGDLDGDGTCDVLIVHGKPKVRRQIVAFSGRTRAFLWEITDPYGHSDFGDTIVRLGDLVDPSGALIPDGVPDFAVGAPTSAVGVAPTYPGLVHVYSGATPGAGPVHTLVGSSRLVSFGASIRPVSDLDGDGKPALAVGAPGGGYVELFDGPGWTSWERRNSPLPGPVAFGSSLADLGDIDGDGATELAVGVPGAAGGFGRVYVYSLKAGGSSLFRTLDPTDTAAATGFGASIASLPVDPLTGRGLLDLDHDGVPDPFLDWNRDGRADYVVGAPWYETLQGFTGAGAIYLVAGTDSFAELVQEPIEQGSFHPQLYSYLVDAQPAEGELFGSRIELLGNPLGESQVRLAAGTRHDQSQRGGFTMLRPPLLHFDDDTFSIPNDVVGTSRHLELDFGPRYAGRRYYVLGSSSGANPGQVFQGFRIPLDDDGPGGLWRRTLLGTPGGTPLGFSQLSGLLDALGRATVTITVTGPTATHPWFQGLRQHYAAVLEQPGQPGRILTVTAPVPLFVN